MKFKTFFAFIVSFIVVHAGFSQSVLTSALDNKLVEVGRSGFEQYDASRLEGKKYIAVYFSAHWCPPCNVFTPKLVQMYNRLKRESDEFELIFVSLDRSEPEMLRYMKSKRMPWPALKYDEINTNSYLSKYSGPGIPCLVVIDLQGNVVLDTFDRMPGSKPQYRDIDQVLQAFKRLISER